MLFVYPIFLISYIVTTIVLGFLVFDSPLSSQKAILDMVSSLPIYKHNSRYRHLVICDRDPLWCELLATVLLLLWQLYFLPFWYPLKIPLFFTKIKFSLIFILSSYEYISTFFSSLSRLVFLFILILISTGWQITHERMRVFIFFVIDELALGIPSFSRFLCYLSHVVYSNDDVY